MIIPLNVETEILDVAPIFPVKEMDQRFMKIQELIESKKESLIHKQKKLRSISKQNQFLETVKNDYQKYYQHIEQQKKDQIRALSVLDEYIKDLTVSGKLTKYNIEDAKEEQGRILKEVKHIKRGLDKLIHENTPTS